MTFHDLSSDAPSPDPDPADREFRTLEIPRVLPRSDPPPNEDLAPPPTGVFECLEDLLEPRRAVDLEHELALLQEELTDHTERRNVTFHTLCAAGTTAALHWDALRRVLLRIVLEAVDACDPGQNVALRSR